MFKFSSVKFTISSKLMSHLAGRTFNIGKKTITSKERAAMIPTGYEYKRLPRLLKEERFTIPTNADRGIFKDPKHGITAIFGESKHGFNKLQTLYPKGMSVRQGPSLRYWDINNGKWLKEFLYKKAWLKIAKDKAPKKEQRKKDWGKVKQSWSQVQRDWPHLGKKWQSTKSPSPLLQNEASSVSKTYIHTTVPDTALAVKPPARSSLLKKGFKRAS